MGPGEWIVIALSVVLIGWFLFGSSYSQNRQKALFQKFALVLKDHGKFSPIKYLDPASFQVRFTPTDQDIPFRMMEFSFLMERRENLLLWLVQRAGGKRDNILINANAEHSPVLEIHAVSPEEDHAIQLFNQNEKIPFTHLSDIGRMKIYTRGGDVIPDAWQAYLKEHHAELLRISFQQKPPHFCYYAPLSSQGVEDPLSLIHELAKLVEK